MDDPDSQLWILIFLLISFLLSGLFSASEVALLSLTEAKVRALKDQKKRGSSALVWLKNHPHKLIITILIGNNFVNILASVLTTVYVTKSFGSQALGIATGLLTLLILVFGEILPKTYAQTHASSFSLFTSPFVKYLCLVLYPLVWFLEKFSNLVSKKKKKKLSEADVESELLALAEIGEEGGALKKGEKDIIENVLEFSDTTVAEVMTPRTKIDALNQEFTLDEAVDFAINHSHSRIPVYQDDLDNIIGIITLRDLLEYHKSYDGSKKLLALELKDVLFIPHTRKISFALKDFQKEKVQIAIIVDEHGGTEGLCTLEDLMEEIFGEIEDESDIPIDHIKKVSENSWLAEANATLDEIENHVGISIDPDDSKAISLIVLEKLGRFPKNGEKIDLGGIYIVVDKMGDKKIERVRIVKNLENT